MVDFQQQSPQRLVNEYGHMNSQNDRLDLILKPLQREYYFIEYEKSYVKQCTCSCFHSLRLLAYTACIMICSSINIQYKRTGIGSLSLLDKIESIRSLRCLFISPYGTFRSTGM